MRGDNFMSSVCEVRLSTFRFRKVISIRFDSICTNGSIIRFDSVQQHCVHWTLVHWHSNIMT